MRSSTDVFVYILPLLKGSLPSIIALQPPPSDAEKLLLRSIERTTFLEATYNTALEQANVICAISLVCPRSGICNAGTG